MDAKALKALTGHKRQMAREKKVGITKYEDQPEGIKRIMRVLAAYHFETSKATEKQVKDLFRKL